MSDAEFDAAMSQQDVYGLLDQLAEKDAEIERLKRDYERQAEVLANLHVAHSKLLPERDRLAAIVEQAATWLETISSGDGSGHADLARRIRTDAAAAAKEPSP